MTIPSPPRPSRRLPAPERRVLLLAAASDVVAAVGPRRARLVDVARRAGVSKALLYQHFPSKEAMLVALIEDHGRALITEFKLHHAGSDPRARLRDGLHAVLSYAQREPAAWRILFVERFDEERVSAAQAAVLDAGATMIARRIAADLDAAGRGRLAEILAHLSRSAIDGLIAWWYDNPDTAIDELTDIGTAFLWSGLQQWTRAKHEI